VGQFVRLVSKQRWRLFSVTFHLSF